jgi:starch-binding outer membrane protein SusE/F
MKKIFKITCFTSLLLFGLWSCKKEGQNIVFKGGTPPVLTSSVSGEVPLSLGSKSNVAIVFKWTNPDYQFSTGVNSLDVTYTLQIDSAGANFTSPDMQERSIAKDLTTTLTVGDFNTYLAKLGMAENISHNIEVRIKAALVNGSVPLYSNIIKFTATPFLDVAVPLPATGNLYLIGDATSNGWTNPVPVPEFQFTKTSSTTYEITVPLIGGKSYLAIPDNGSWSHKYSVKNNPAVSGLNQGGFFGYDLNDNIPGPDVSGTYKIKFDFKVGKFTVTKM